MILSRLLAEWYDGGFGRGGRDVEMFVCGIFGGSLFSSSIACSSPIVFDII